MVLGWAGEPMETGVLGRRCWIEGNGASGYVREDELS